MQDKNKPNEKKISVTILTENTSPGHGLEEEYGIAIWVDTGAHRLLFDTGQGLGNTLYTNARQLDVHLNKTDAIVISHGHYDHVGGLLYVLLEAAASSVYIHPSAFQPKYGSGSNGARYIGMSSLVKGTIDAKAEQLFLTEKPTEIFDGIFVTGEIPRITEFEDTGRSFYLDKKLSKPDPLIDDQAIFFESSHGTVVLLGCAHAGIINTLHYVKHLTDNKPIYAVAGGMHLKSASRKRIDQTIDALCQLKVEKLWPCHCTGMEAVVRLNMVFGKQCFPCYVGKSLDFEIN